MAPATRSRTQTAQNGSDDKIKKLPIKRKSSNTSNTASAKKSKTSVNKADSKDKKKPSKKVAEPKVEHESEDDVDEANDTIEQGNTAGDTHSIIINRAPVLELWSACVASFLHPKLSWSTCLSVGSAISGLAAISKGRSIGTISQPDPGSQAEKQEKRASAQENLDEVHVMTFSVKLEDGLALVGDKPKKSNEETLRKKYGDHYDEVKKVMQDTLQNWQGKQNELNKRAFHMYEDFRPSVAAGQKGWGRKGELSFDNIKSSTAAS